MELPESGAKRTGAMLSAGRIAAGLELVDVARETRVPLRHLKALEADRHDELPALPYAIGFVKAYARAIGLDPETVAAQFRGETSKSAHVPTPMTLEPLDERRLPSRGLVFGSLAAIVLIIAGLSAWGAGVFDPPAATETAGVTAPAAEVVTAVEPAPPVAATSAAPMANALPPAGGAVVLTAREDVWVKIYDGTTKVNAKIGILKTGEQYQVPADQPGLLLWTGKAGALDITVGGTPVLPLGGPVETVRDVSLTAADLIARQSGTPSDAATSRPKPIATIPRPAPEPVAAPATAPGV